MGIGYRIKEARESLGLTQAELGAKIGVTGSAITNYENNVSHPKEPILYKLLEVLKVDPNYLFQDEININRNIKLTLSERRIILKQRKLDELDKQKVETYIDDLLINPKYTSNIVSFKNEPTEEPEYVNTGRAIAYGGMVEETKLTAEQDKMVNDLMYQISEEQKNGKSQ